MEDSAGKITELNEQQKSGMDAAKLLAEMGLDVTVYASTEADRKAGMENGNIRLSDGSIRVDLNAGADGQGVMAFALSHEFTHFVEEMSPAKFQAFTDILFEEMGKKGADVSALIEAKAQTLGKMEENKSLSENKLNDLAYSEVTAEMMETALTDTDVMERISARLQQADKSLWGKIKDFLKGLVDRLKAAYKGLNPDSSIAQLARETINSSERVLDAFADAASDAVVNYRLQDGQKNNAAEGVQYSLRGQTQQELTTKYQQEVDQVLNEPYTNARQLIVGYTPTVYQQLGMPSLPLTIGSGHVYSAAKTETEARQDGNYKRGVHYHGLGDAAVKNIYNAIQDPVMVIAAKDVNKNVSPLRSTHSVVAIVDIGTTKKSLLVPIEITAERTVNGEQMDVNTISSVYEKSVKSLVAEAIAQENAGEIGVYYAKKEALTLPAAGVQFPARLQQSIASDGIVHRFSEKVNMKISENIQSQQFKRWFGDWQNDPASASKVVNEDGTPKVVYHGTNEEFTVFDLSKSGKNYGETSEGLFFFTNKRSGYQDSASDYAEAAARSGGKATVGEYYLSIKNPLRLYSDGYYTPTAYFDQNAQDVYEKYLSGDDYDGIIIENSNKSADDSVIYLLDTPNQIKSATDNIGTFDSSNPDIRYSSRQRAEGKAEQLATEVEYLKKLVQIQKKGNSDYTLDRTSLRQFASQLIRENGASGSSTELAALLEDTYNYISRSTDFLWEGIEERAGKAVDWLEAHRKVQRDSYAQEVLDFMSKRHVKLSEAQLGEVQYQYGNLKEFRSAIRGSIVLDQNANTTLDQFWQEGAAQFGDKFSADITDTDMPGALAELVQSLKESRSTESMEAMMGTYAKTTEATSFVENSFIMYADEKRTTSLLRSIGFHMPIELLQSGYIGSISYNRRSVNT